MKRSTKTLTTTAVFFLACGLVCLEARAEVSARLDRDGKYLWTRVAPSSASPTRVWTARNGFRLRSRRAVLNPQGDRRGDLWPVVAESPLRPHHPWVVWSRRNGPDYDLVWSRWLGYGWEVISPVAAGGPAVAGDDLDPDVRVSPQGRPVLVWLRNEAGRGQVYFSIFLASRWSDPFPVSSPSTNAFHPRIETLEEGLAHVRYETADGWVTHLVSFDEPVTITDDINPQVKLDGPSQVQQNP